MTGSTADITVKKFLEAVKKGKPVKELKKRLEGSPKEVLRTWKDEDSLDMLHHTIMLQQPEAVELLLAEGYVDVHYKSTVNMYPHLTCKLGYSLILKILLKYRLDEFYLKGNVILSGDGQLQSESGDKKYVKQFPLDIAAEEKNIECVTNILDKFKENQDVPFNNYIAQACLANSAFALYLLIQYNEPLETNVIKYCVDMCLRRAQPDCLNILLQLKVDLSSLFDNINLFHILYSYSENLYSSENKYGLLPRLTSVLIKNGQSVNVKLPPRTYPLYSLLSYAFCNDRFTRHYLKSLEILLSKGAEPCFDEVAFERSKVKEGIKPVMDRESFSSAIHCLLQNIEMYCRSFQSRTSVLNFILGFGDLLIRFKASCRQVGRVGASCSIMKGSILDQYAKTSVKTGVDLDVIRWILEHGADPNQKHSGKYAINIYVNTLCEKLSVDKASKYAEYQKDIEIMLIICNYMDFASLNEARHIIANKPEKQISEYAKPYVDHIKNELRKRSTEIKSLRRLASWVVWKLCDMATSNVGSLNVSAKITTDIIPLLETLSY